MSTKSPGLEQVDAFFLVKKVLLNLIFYPSFVLVTVLLPVVCFVPMLLVRIALGARKTLYLFRMLIRWYGFIVVRVLPFPFVRVEYQDFDSERTRGACVFVCNHRSSSDAFLMESLDRELVQVVNDWPFRIPVIGLLGRLAGYLDVRGIPFEEFVRSCCSLLRDGVSVVAFPEGARSRGEGMHQFHGAVFRAAQTAGVPIVPVCLSGNQDIPAKGSWVLNPGTVRIHKLPAFDFEAYGHLSAFELKNRVRAVIQTELDRLASGKADQRRGGKRIRHDSPGRIGEGHGNRSNLPVKASAYIPHAAEMCIIDDLVAVSEGAGEAEVTIRSDSPFVRPDGTVEECLYVEMIAQTIAAASGFERTREGRTPEGYLLGIRSLKILRAARVGELLRIEARKAAEFGGFSVVEGIVRRGSQVLSEGEIKVFQGSEQEGGPRIAAT